MRKVFVDTNVFVYAFDHANPSKQMSAVNLLRMMRSRFDASVISTQVLQEFYNILTRKLRVDAVIAKHEMLLLAHYQVVILVPPLLGSAADLHATASLSFWDALIITAAQSADCDEIWTEDLQDGQTFGKLKITNPFKNNPVV